MTKKQQNGNSPTALPPCNSNNIHGRAYGPPTKHDERQVYLSSLTVISAVIWVPSLFVYVYKKWKKTPVEDKRKRTLYRNLLIAMITIIVIGPHRNPRFGNWLNVRRWKLWESWLRYVTFEVISEHAENDGKGTFDRKKDQAILAIVPHGIVPFSLCFAALPQAAIEKFGKFRPVIASATRLFPLGRTLMEWMSGVDATKSSVNQALSQGERLGLCPGGISEMFEGRVC